MPLDAQTRRMVERISSYQQFDPRMSPPEVRAMLRARPSTITQPEPVYRVEDVAIPGPAGEIPLRLYTPSDETPLPLFVYFHGGGWVVGDIQTQDAPCRTIANAVGCKVANVEYRLAPEDPFPAGPEDAYAATRWLSEHAAEIGVDPKRIAVGGQSAGGNLAAVVPLMARDRGGPPLALQLLIYPCCDAAMNTPSYEENAEGYLLTRERMRWYWGHYLPDEAAGREPYASPLRATDLRGLPPAVVITAEYDPLRDEGEAYAARLREAGVPVEAVRYEGQTHGVFAWLAPDEGENVVMQRCVEALRSAFGLRASDV